MIAERELFWLAGILEGEGYFGLRSDDRKTVQLKVEMTDEDIVLRIAHIVGKVTSKHYDLSYVSRKDKRHVSDTCILALYGKDAAKIMKLIVPFMGQRRRKKIWQTLNGHFEQKIKIDKAVAKADLMDLIPQPKVIPIRRRA